MAEVDPLTGLASLEFQRPQTEKFQESLLKKLESGGAKASQKKYLDDRSYQAELNRYRGYESPTEWQRTFLGELETDWATIRSLEAQKRNLESDLIREWYGKDDLQSRKIVRPENLPMIRELEGRISSLRTKAPPTQAGLEAFKETGEGKLIVGAIEGLDKENQLLGEISGFRTQAERAMALELQRRMEEIGYQEGEARASIGEVGAKKGVLRSTFTQRGIEQSALREQERIGTERIGVQSSITNLRDAEAKLIKDIENQREQLLTIRSASELEQLERQRNMLVESELRTNFQQVLANSQMSAMKKQQMMGTLTSLASTAVMAVALCWVARAVFGPDNVRWVHARTYIIQDSPLWFYRLYSKHGESFAKIVEKSKILKAMLKPLFLYFAKKGEKRWQ